MTCVRGTFVCVPSIFGLDCPSGSRLVAREFLLEYLSVLLVDLLEFLSVDMLEDLSVDLLEYFDTQHLTIRQENQRVPARIMEG